jgi:hypothetical protein
VPVIQKYSCLRTCMHCNVIHVCKYRPCWGTCPAGIRCIGIVPKVICLSTFFNQVVIAAVTLSFINYCPCKCHLMKAWGCQIVGSARLCVVLHCTAGSRHLAFFIVPSIESFTPFSPEGGVGLVPKRGCLHTLAYYAFPRWYEFGERRWNDILTGKSKNSEKNLSQFHFIHHKSHMDWPRHEPKASTVRGRRLTTWDMARPFTPFT